MSKSFFVCFSIALLCPLTMVTGCGTSNETTVMPEPEIDEEAYEQESYGEAANDPAQN